MARTTDNLIEFFIFVQCDANIQYGVWGGKEGRGLDFGLLIWRRREKGLVVSYKSAVDVFCEVSGLKYSNINFYCITIQ